MNHNGPGNNLEGRGKPGFLKSYHTTPKSGRHMIPGDRDIHALKRYNLSPIINLDRKRFFCPRENHLMVDSFPDFSTCPPFNFLYFKSP